MFGADAGAGIAGFAITLIFIILAVLAVFMPWFVYRIKKNTESLATEVRNTNKLLNEILKNAGAIEVIKKQEVR